MRSEDELTAYQPLSANRARGRWPHGRKTHLIQHCKGVLEELILWTHHARAHASSENNQGSESSSRG
eukprot:4486871-Pleurochrysis_carterae.AAC.1